MNLIQTFVFGESSGVNSYRCRWCVVFAVLICWSSFGCSEGVKWELSVEHSEKDNHEVLRSFYVESNQVKIDHPQKEGVYLIYSNPSSACFFVQDPPKSSLRVNYALILVAEFYGCDLVSKVENAKHAGYDGVILIRQGFGSNEQETHIRNLKFDFNVFFADKDEGFNIREFAFENVNDPFRHKVKLRPVDVSGNWFDFDTTEAVENLNLLYARIQDCEQFLIKNLDIVVASGILLVVGCFIVYSLIIAIWHELCWILQSLYGLIRTAPTPTPVTPVKKPFVALPEVTWQESVADLPSSCAICFDNFRPNDQLVKLPCRHLEFHKPCIHEWLKVGDYQNCPICREPVPASFLDPAEFPRRPEPYLEDDPILMNDINNDLINLILDQIIVNSTNPVTTYRARTLLNQRNNI